MGGMDDDDGTTLIFIKVILGKGKKFLSKSLEVVFS